MSFRESPTVRFLVRVAVVAALGYVLGIIDTGEAFSLRALGAAAIAGTCKAAIGLWTPEEPFVGWNKTTVEVPVPPADPEPAR